MLESFVDTARTIRMDTIMARVLSRHTDEMVALQKKRIGSGKRVDGSSFTPYTKPYLPVRRKFSRPTAPKDYNLSGDHYAGMFADVGGSFTQMGSDDWKELILESMEKDKLYGLTDDDISTLLWENGVADEFVQEYITEFK
jgi:hypothetical protein